MRALLWFRGKDLRLRDHPALVDACARADELVCLFVLSPRYFAPGFTPSPAAAAPHRVQYLLRALNELSAELSERGCRLLVLPGPAEQCVPRLCERLGIDEVVACAGNEPEARARDAAVRSRLRVPLRLHESETLTPPGTLLNGSGEMFQVFTPFARALQKRVRVAAALPVPRRWPPMAAVPGDLGEVPIPSLTALGLRENPMLLLGGEAEARARLRRFVQKGATHYETERDRMDLPRTSRLSADLRFGTLSVRTAFTEAQHWLEHEAPRALERFQLELLWREFAYHWLWTRPALLEQPFRRDFQGFPWRDDDDGWNAWVEGRTGYPVVDAAARQLLGEGFVHNRARMVSASFLTKHLLISYQHGEAHYMKWLVDGDPASNNLGWQWSAGCGCDAQPYFRVFNPVTQGERFDPEGNYVRRWLPELAALPTKYIHAPWTAPNKILQAANIKLDATYPRPIIDHATARDRFLSTAKAHLSLRSRSHSP